MFRKDVTRRRFAKMFRKDVSRNVSTKYV